MGLLYDFFQGRKKKNARDYQTDAGNALRGRWGIAILAALIASLFGAGGGGVSFSFDMDDFDADLLAVPSGEELLTAASQTWLLGVVAACLVFAVLIGLVVYALVAGPVQVGYERFNLDLVTGKHATIETLFSFFKKKIYGSTVRLSIRYALVMMLYSLPMLLGTVLLLGGGVGALCSWESIPSSDLLQLGVIALIGLGVMILGLVWLIVNSYKYCMSFKILAESPNLSAREAMLESKQLMQGNKWAMFCLHCSFIGWFFLSMLTFGIGLIWLNPFVRAAEAAFYRNISLRRRFGAA